jgi:lycopene beta-cyclase
MYVLPTSPTEALLEYTLFSHDLAKAEYETAIKDTSLSWDTNYSITEKNKEASNDLLPVLEKKYTKVLNIGTAGVDKESTGYTFKIQINIQLVQFLEQGRNLKNFTIKLNFGIMTCCY